MTSDQAAQAIRGDKPKISRIESGRHRVSRLELDVLLDLFQVEDPKVREWLVALSTEGQRRNWWRRYGEELESDFKEQLTLESDAKRIVAFQAQVLPGLLQTHAYASAVIRASDPQLSDEQVEFETKIRMERQEILEKADPPDYVCIVTEGVIRQQVGGQDVMAAQLNRLVELSTRANITIQVIPFSQDGDTGTSGSFVVYSYPDPLDLDVVQISYLDGALYLEDDIPVMKHRRKLDSLRSSALKPGPSIDLISAVARELVL